MPLLEGRRRTFCVDSALVVLSLNDSAAGVARMDTGEVTVKLTSSDACPFDVPEALTRMVAV